MSLITYRLTPLPFLWHSVGPTEKALLQSPLYDLFLRRAVTAYQGQALDQYEVRRRQRQPPCCTTLHTTQFVTHLLGITQLNTWMFQSRGAKWITIQVPGRPGWIWNRPNSNRKGKDMVFCPWESHWPSQCKSTQRSAGIQPHGESDSSTKHLPVVTISAITTITY